VHDTEPAFDMLPAMQLEQLVVPAVGLYLPAAHGMQVALSAVNFPDAEKVPGKQLCPWVAAVQLVAPAVEVVPAAQGVHVPEPVEEKVPATQGTKLAQAEIPLEQHDPLTESRNLSAEELTPSSSTKVIAHNSLVHAEAPEASGSI